MPKIPTNAMSMARVAIIKETREEPLADNGFRTKRYIAIAVAPTRRNERGTER